MTSLPASSVSLCLGEVLPLTPELRNQSASRTSQHPGLQFSYGAAIRTRDLHWVVADAP